MHQNVKNGVFSPSTHDWHHSATEEQRNAAFEARHKELREAFKEAEEEKKRKEYQEFIDSVDLNNMSKRDQIEFGRQHGRYHEDIELHHRVRDKTLKQKNGKFDTNGNPEFNKDTGFKFKGEFRKGTQGHIKDVKYDEDGNHVYVVDQVNKDGEIETKNYSVDALHARGVTGDHALWHPDVEKRRFGGDEERKKELEAQVKKLVGPKGDQAAEEVEEERGEVVVPNDPEDFDLENPDQHFEHDEAARSYDLIDEDIGNYSQTLAQFFDKHGGDDFEVPYAYDIQDSDKMRQVWGHWLSQSDLSPEVHKEIFHDIQTKFTNLKSRMMGLSGKNDIGKIYQDIDAGKYDSDPTGKAKAMARIRNYMMFKLL